MSISIEEVRKMLLSGAIPANTNDVVETGELLRNNGDSVGYQLHHGWDIAKALACDLSWGAFNLELMRFVDKQQYDEKELIQVLEKIQMDDAHWRWFDKSLAYKVSEYEWFFLMAEQKPQGACLIYHPKDSVLGEGKIFYIEFIATAPWNRENPMAVRDFKGVASIMIKYVVNYAHDQLKLRHGFSLHALPKATGFYKKIGMNRHVPSDHDQLQYFEMPEQNASKLVGV